MRVVAFERASALIVHALERNLVHIMKLGGCNSRDSLDYDIAPTWLVVKTLLTIMTYWHSEDAVSFSRKVTNNVQGYAV